MLLALAGDAAEGEKMEGPASHLRQVLKTLVIVAAGSAVLYLVVTQVAEHGLQHGAQYWLALLLTAPVLFLVARGVYQGLRDGEVPVYRRYVARKSQPVAYWLNMAWMAAATIALFALAIYAITQLA